MTWWAAGFVVHQTVVHAWAARGRRPAWPDVARGALRSVAFATIAAGLVIGGLGTARWYQRRTATAMLASYVAAPKVALDPSGTLSGIPPRAWPQYLEVDVDQARCGRSPAVTFRYDPNTPDAGLSRTVTVSRFSRTPGVTRILQPVFEHYVGLALSDPRPGCLAGVSRVADLHRFPVLLGVTLPPDWPSLPLYQRLAEWERDPSLPPFAPLPPLSTWALASGKPPSVGLFGTLKVVGDRTTSGYQLTSPRVDAPVGASVFVRTDLTASRGRVCLGALNGSAATWLSPASGVRQEMRFTVDESGGFMVAVANCNPSEIPSASVFRLSKASYAVE